MECEHIRIIIGHSEILRVPVNIFVRFRGTARLHFLVHARWPPGTNLRDWTSWLCETIANTSNQRFYCTLKYTWVPIVESIHLRYTLPKFQTCLLLWSWMVELFERVSIIGKRVPKIYYLKLVFCLDFAGGYRTGGKSIHRNRWTSIDTIGVPELGSHSPYQTRTH